jgi:replicative DNA helicase
MRGYNIIYFSLEMPYEDCFIRFLASLANVSQRGLAKSTLSHEEELRVEKAKQFIKAYQNSGYYFDIVDVPRNLTIEEVELRYQDAMLRYRPDVVVIDYMGLMHSVALAKEQDWLKVGGIAASLHEFGRAYDNSVITAAQLTDLKRSANSSKDDNRAVGMHRWGRSSLIMHHVNLGIQINTRQNEIHLPDLEIHVVKNRKGPLGQGSLIKNFANASLIDVPYDQKQIPGDVSSSIPDLIRSIQEAKNKKD